MIRTATLPLRGTRTSPLVLPFTVRGPDLTGAALHAVVLQNWDNDPDAPEIDLPDGAAENATGIRKLGAETVDGVIETRFALTIALADMEDLPPAGEVGEDLGWKWYLNVTIGSVQQRWIEGDFIIGGAAAGRGAVSGAVMTVRDESIAITVDGVDLIAPLVAQAEAAAESAATDAATAQENASALYSTDTQVIGRPAGVTLVTGTAANAAQTWVMFDPVAKAGPLTEVTFTASATGSIKIKRFDSSGDFVEESPAIAIGSTGTKTLTAANFGDLVFEVGDRVAYYHAASGVTTYTNRAPDGAGMDYFPGDVTSSVSYGSSETLVRPQIRFTIGGQVLSVNAETVGGITSAAAGFASSDDRLIVAGEDDEILAEITGNKIAHPMIDVMAAQAASDHDRLRALEGTSTIALAGVVGLHIEGQSNSNGTDAYPPLGTSAISYAKMFAKTGGTEGTVRPYKNSGTAAQVRAAMVDLLEQDENPYGGETGCTGAAMMIRQMLLRDPGEDLGEQLLLCSAPGQGSTTVADLTANYLQRLKDDITYGAARAAGIGRSYLPAAIPMVIGETDTDSGTSIAQFKTDVGTMQGLLRTHITSVTGVNRECRMIWAQTASHVEQGKTPNGALAQMQLAEEDDHAIAVPLGALGFDTSTPIHLSAHWQRVLGAYIGLALYRWDWLGLKPRHLKPTTASVIGSYWLQKFDVPHGRLQFDTSRFTESRMGFRLYDTATNSVITQARDPRILPGGVVELQATGAIPATAVLQIGFTGSDGKHGRTNLRDSQGDSIIFDPGGMNVPLHNWMGIAQVEHP